MLLLSRKIGYDVSSEGLGRFFAALDKDRSGTVDVQEFYTFWIWTMLKEGGNCLLLKFFLDVPFLSCRKCFPREMVL